MTDEVFVISPEWHLSSANILLNISRWLRAGPIRSAERIERCCGVQQQHMYMSVTYPYGVMDTLTSASPTTSTKYSLDQSRKALNDRAPPLITNGLFLAT